MALLVWYSIKYGLNYFNTLPIKNIPAYTIIFGGVTILGLLYLSFNGIYIRYSLSFIFNLLNYLTASSLIYNIPIFFSLLLKASWPLFIYFITALSCPIVTTYKSGFNIPAILVLCPTLDAGVVFTIAFSGILLIPVLL